MCILAVSLAQGQEHDCSHAYTSSLADSCAWLVKSVRGRMYLAVMALQTSSVVFDLLLMQVSVMLQLVG